MKPKKPSPSPSLRSSAPKSQLAESQLAESLLPERLGVVVRQMVRQADRAALASMLANQDRPYASLVGLATDVDGTPVLLLSRLAEHTRAILKNPQVSLLVDGTQGFANPQEGPRVSLLGRLQPGRGERLARRFLSRHPGAALYAAFADFSYYTLEIERIQWVGGFGRAQWLSPRPACDAAAAAAFDAALADVERALLAQDGDGLGAIARRRLGKRGKAWRLSAIDPDGCELQSGGTAHRLTFDPPQTSPEGVTRALLDFLGNG